MKRKSPLITGVNAIKDGEINVKSYTAEEVFNLQKDLEKFFLYVLDDDGLNTYNVQAKQFENAEYYITAEIPHVAKLLNKMPEC